MITGGCAWLWAAVVAGLGVMGLMAIWDTRRRHRWKKRSAMLRRFQRRNGNTPIVGCLLCDWQYPDADARCRERAERMDTDNQD